MSNTAGLPRSYLIKQRQDHLNIMCHVIITPGKAEGAQLSFKDVRANCLCASLLRI